MKAISVYILPILRFYHKDKIRIKIYTQGYSSLFVLVKKKKKVIALTSIFRQMVE